MRAKSAIFVQARIDSSRLPGKALLPLGNEPSILSCVLKNLYGCAERHVLLCPADAVQAFSPIAEACGYDVIQGPKDDVLGRFVLGQEQVQAEWIIRATGDNPVVPAALAKELLDCAQKQAADYACFDQTPYGAGVQILHAGALLKAGKEAQTPEEREHVCPYITEHRDLFKICEPIVAQKWRAPELHATIDTMDDYEYIKAFYEWKMHRDRDILENFMMWAKSRQNGKVG